MGDIICPSAHKGGCAIFEAYLRLVNAPAAHDIIFSVRGSSGSGPYICLALEKVSNDLRSERPDPIVKNIVLNKNAACLQVLLANHFIGSEGGLA